MSAAPLKPARVVLAVVGGLAVGLALVRTFTPHTSEQGEGDPVEASSAPPHLKRAAAAAATADAGAARVSQDILADRLPPYPRAGAWVHLGDRIDSNRVPMAMASFETPDSDAKVLEYYAQYFEHRGFPWQGIEESLKTTGLPALSATDVVGELQLSVVAFAHPGGTTVVLAAADMQTFYQRANAGLTDDGDLPGYPGSTPTVMRSAESSTDSVMVSFATPDSVSDVVAFYRATLPSQGFTEVAVEQPEGSALHHLQFVADGRSWQLFLGRASAGTAVTAQGERKARP